MCSDFKITPKSYKILENLDNFWGNLILVVGLHCTADPLSVLTTTLE